MPLIYSPARAFRDFLRLFTCQCRIYSIHLFVKCHLPSGNGGAVSVGDGCALQMTSVKPKWHYFHARKVLQYLHARTPSAKHTVEAQRGIAWQVGVNSYGCDVFVIYGRCGMFRGALLWAFWGALAIGDRMISPPCF